MLKKISSALAALTSVVHFFAGGAGALAPMLAAGLAPEAEGGMHACWHIVTAFLVWSVVVFWRGGETAFHFGLLWVASALVFIYVGLAQAGLAGLVTNPQWTILGLTGGIAVVSSLRQMRVADCDK